MKHIPILPLFLLALLCASCATTRTLRYVDGQGGKHKMKVNPNVERHDYNVKGFSLDGDTMSYTGDGRYTYRLGVDISRHDGKVDWEQLKAGGREFVILRIGYRGYQTGILHVDENFHDNIAGAQAAGLDVGVYIFSQAVSEEEAEEEADLVLRELEGYTIQLPVVFDPERILTKDPARTDDTSGEQFTRNTVVFCERIRAAGYEPMVYSNLIWEADEFDMERLADYQIWYADYIERPQTPYRFTFWQYSAEGSPSGTNGEYPTDLDIQLIPTGN